MKLLATTIATLAASSQSSMLADSSPANNLAGGSINDGSVIGIQNNTDNQEEKSLLVHAIRRVKKALSKKPKASKFTSKSSNKLPKSSKSTDSSKSTKNSESVKFSSSNTISKSSKKLSKSSKLTNSSSKSLSTAPSLSVGPSHSAQPSASPSISAAPSVSASPSLSLQPTVDVSDEEIEELLEDVSEATVDAIQTFLKPFADIVRTTPSCHTGSPDEVKRECNGCCEGTEACDWEGSATICDGACAGSLSCNNIPANSVIMERSCVGVESCQNMGSNTTAVNTGDTEYVPLFVARDSCVYTGSNSPVCQSMGGSSQSVVVGSDSCKPDASCYEFGENTSGTIFVGSQSCDAFAACYAVARDAEAAEINIAPGACKENLACSVIAQYSTSLESISIAGGSCVGRYSCLRMGRYDASSVTVDKQSCRTLLACNLLGFQATGNITIGSSSCDEGSSCRRLGENAAVNVAVGNSSCARSANVCRRFGRFASGAFVAVQDGVCTSDNTEVCNAFGANGVADCLGINCTSSFIMVENGTCAGICDP